MVDQEQVGALNVEPSLSVNSEVVSVLPVPESERPQEPFVIEADLQDRVCYAMAHNRVPTIRNVRIRNEKGGVSGEVLMTISSRWGASPIAPLREWTTTVKCPDFGETVEFSGRDCLLDPASLVELDEAAPAVIRIEIKCGEVRQNKEFDVQIMSRNQWIHDPELFELTSAFVQPSHPSVQDILNDVTVYLKNKTGDGSIQGYQAGPDRAKQIGMAVYYALQSKISSYLDTPPSYEEEGQRIRPLDEVLERGMGNCLDFACAYASCLEYAGLCPVIFIVHSHAYSGFLLNQGSLNKPVLRLFSEIINEIESGKIVSVETTLLGSDSSFEEAEQGVMHHNVERSLGCRRCQFLIAGGISGGGSHLEALIDVAQTRTHIRPIPARVIRDGVITVVIDNGPSRAPVIERRDAKTRKLLPNTVPARVQQWKNTLLQLDFKNQLLNYNPQKSAVELIPGKGVLSTLEDHLNAGERFTVMPLDVIGEVNKVAGFRTARDLFDGKISEFWSEGRSIFSGVEDQYFATRLRNVLSKARQDEQETGVNSLHLTLGSLKWGDDVAQGRGFVSPIFLIPIRGEIKRGKNVAAFAIDPGAITTPNHCLIEYLRQKSGLKLQWFSDDMSDAMGLDIDAGFKAMRAELSSSGLAAKGYEVVENASIGFLRFSKVRLWKDLADHWQDFAKKPLVRHFIENPNSQFKDPKNLDGGFNLQFDDTTLMNPQPADGAQTRAVVRALADHTFVLEGPPGTGKSQTIANLLANALSKGKKVLFVAEKQTALSVVQERLTAVGLEAFCLDLHDKGSKPEDIKRQLRAALDVQPVADLKKWETLEKKFEAAVMALVAYRNRIHSPNSAGTTYFEAHCQLLQLADGPFATVKRNLLKRSVEEIEAIRRILTGLEEVSLPARPSATHVWRILEPVDLEKIDLRSLSKTIEQLKISTDELLKFSSGLMGALRFIKSFDELEALISFAKLISGNSLVASDHAVVSVSTSWHEISNDDWLEKIETKISTIRSEFAKIAQEVSLSDKKLIFEDQTQLLASAKEAAKKFFIGRKGKVREALGSYANFKLFEDVEPEQVIELILKLDAAGKIIRASHETLSKSPLLKVDMSTDLTEEPIQEKVLETARGLFAMSQVMSIGSERSSLAGSFASVLVANSDDPISFGNSLSRFYESFAKFKELLLISDEGLNAWLCGKPIFEEVSGSVNDWSRETENGSFLGLTRWLRLLNHLAPLTKFELTNFRDELLTGKISANNAANSFERALMLLTLTEIAEANDLDVFDHHVHTRRVSDFVQILEERQEMIKTVIPKKLADSRNFSASAKTGLIGQLHQELASKKRGARSIREILKKYPDLIAALTPCFLMSPDSVAKFIAPGILDFDIVVFDEASQITVADAVGALGRANSAVVVGDSKQMPPTRTFSSTSDDGEDIIFEQDENPLPDDSDSILEECVIEAGVSREWLGWHYRSRDEILISFSNSKYYEGRLSSFPSPETIRHDCGITYNFVANGQFDHGHTRTNSIEAEAIVAEVERRLSDPQLRRLSMGIITLNLEQKRLIESKIVSSKNEKLQEIFESEDPDKNLFVLNLESVQGRERDVIFMGTSFSKRLGGGKMPLNFGPLTNPGGERRLNVAVTRAKRQMVVFSSFDPLEMKDAKSVGMVHLRDYLEMAKRVSAGLRETLAVAPLDQDDYHLDVVAKALEARGLVIKKSFGLSSFKVDIAVTLPGFEDRWLVGVLLDGLAWGSRDLALDRDALPLTVLSKMMGWDYVARVWLPGWRIDSSEIVESIYDLAIKASTKAREEPMVVEEQPRREILVEDESQSAPKNESPQVKKAAQRPAVERDYVENVFAPISSDIEILMRKPDLGRDVIKKITEGQGPLQADVALKILAGLFGVGRVTKTRLKDLQVLLPDELLVDTPFGICLFPSNLVLNGQVSDDFDWYRASTPDQRKVQDIPSHELKNVMKVIVRESFSISNEDLANAVLEVFSYQRKTKDTVGFLLEVVEWACEQNYLSEENGQIKLKSDT